MFLVVCGDSIVLLIYSGVTESERGPNLHLGGGGGGRLRNEGCTI